MFPVTGDGCFYVGLGGKGQFPKNSFEPYQCCPSSKPSDGSKVVKLSASTKQVATKSAQKQTKQQEKPFTTVRKDAKVVKRPPPHQVSSTKPLGKPPKESLKDQTKGKEKQDKQSGKGKKGFFGTGKYIWWW